MKKLEKLVEKITLNIIDECGSECNMGPAEARKKVAKDAPAGMIDGEIMAWCEVDSVGIDKIEAALFEAVKKELAKK